MEDMLSYLDSELLLIRHHSVQDCDPVWITDPICPAQERSILKWEIYWGIMKDRAEEYLLVIRAGHPHSGYLRDLWHYRELFLILAWRDIIVRYKQTAIGIAWSIIRPLLGMIVFTVVFKKIANLPSDDVPYPLTVYAAMLIWQFFCNTVSIGSESLLNNSKLISKVYFPRLIIPSTCMMVSLTDFLISALVSVPLFVYYRYLPGWEVVFIPFFIFLTSLLSLGTTYILSALNVKFRDFRFVVPFALQFGIYISPVGFTSTVIPESWRFWFSLNPLVGIIDGIRWALFQTPLYLPSLFLSVAVSLLLFVCGYFIFRSIEREFADVI